MSRRFLRALTLIIHLPANFLSFFVGEDWLFGVINTSCLFFLHSIVVFWFLRLFSACSGNCVFLVCVCFFVIIFFPLFFCMRLPRLLVLLSFWCFHGSISFSRSFHHFLLTMSKSYSSSLFTCWSWWFSRIPNPVLGRIVSIPCPKFLVMVSFLTNHGALTKDDWSTSQILLFSMCWIYTKLGWSIYW